MRWGYASVVVVGLGLFSASAEAEPAAACSAPKTTCTGADGYYASSEDVTRVTVVLDPLLKDLRSCLDAAGGKHVEPAVLIRWDADGKPVSVKVETPGYESLPCVARVSGKASQLQNPHETSVRCDYGCKQPAAPPPVVAPVVVPPAQAQQQPAAPPPAPAEKPKPAVKYEKVWYGQQTLISDGASAAFIITGLSTKVSVMSTIGVVGFYLGAPIVHWAHGNIGSGFGSLALRLFMPPITALMGALAGLIVAGSTNGSNDVGDFFDDARGTVVGAGIGLVAGVLGCVAIDAFGLAYEKELVPVDPPKAAAIKLVPVLRMTGDHGGIAGLGGTF